MASASTPGPAPRKVFVSYARADGPAVAQTLRASLEAEGGQFSVWLDTARIGGGVSWSKAIESALDECDVLVAVLTPGAFISEICRAEQIWALDGGKLVIPVLASGNDVPVYLKGRNYRKFPGQQAQILQDLGHEITTETRPDVRPLRYDTIPNLPQNHVVREGALMDLRNLVFSEGGGSNIAVAAVTGMGGIGKSVLATALCRGYGRTARLSGWHRLGDGGP